LYENRRFALDSKFLGLAYLYLELHDMVNREAQKGYYQSNPQTFQDILDKT
jgi:hypothetical protein